MIQSVGKQSNIQNEEAIYKRNTSTKKTIPLKVPGSATKENQTTGKKTSANLTDLKMRAQRTRLPPLANQSIPLLSEKKEYQNACSPQPDLNLPLHNSQQHMYVQQQLSSPSHKIRLASIPENIQNSARQSSKNGRIGDREIGEHLIIHQGQYSSPVSQR